jgi:hypothetical protein
MASAFVWRMGAFGSRTLLPIEAEFAEADRAECLLRQSSAAAVTTLGSCTAG